jgi:secretion/DNA translocation related TadE-like protein
VRRLGPDLPDACADEAAAEKAGVGEAGADETGAATVLVLAMAGLLCFVAVALAGVTGIVHAQRSAQAAADLAALAAAGALADGEDACASAASVATANGAVLASCDVRHRDAWVSVTVPAPQWAGRRVEVTAEARAGAA